MKILQKTPNILRYENPPRSFFRNEIRTEYFHMSPLKGNTNG